MKVAVGLAMGVVVAMLVRVAASTFLLASLPLPPAFEEFTGSVVPLLFFFEKARTSSSRLLRKRRLKCKMMPLATFLSRTQWYSGRFGT